VFFAIPDKGFSGVGPPPPGLGCCQFGDACETISMDECLADTGNLGFFPDVSCDTQTGLCNKPATNIPTLSEWGLIAMAGVIGIVGFMVMRRRKLTA